MTRKQALDYLTECRDRIDALARKLKGRSYV